MKNVEQVIQAQFANSPSIVMLVQNMNEWVRPDADIDAFFTNFFDIATANTLGLDIWGRIVNISREVLTSTVTYLDNDAYRQLILLKALTNITRWTSPAINQLLQNWLGSGVRAYVLNLGDMRIRYTFEFELTEVQRVIIESSGVFPIPDGVEGFLLATDFPVFGFAEMGTEYVTGWNDAPFLAGDEYFAIN